MSDEEEPTAESVKISKRDRFKGAIAKGKSKLKKKDSRRTDDDVDNFLGVGTGPTSTRDSISTGRPSVSDTLTFASDSRPSTAGSQDTSPQRFTSSEPVTPPQQSPRRIPVPRIDISKSQRWPGAQQVGSEQQDKGTNLLQPEYQARSQSASSLAKRPGRGRGLSVTFTDRPPIIIGEGGDEAQTPVIEISKYKTRARSASPPRSLKVATTVGKLFTKSPLGRSPLPVSPAPAPRPGLGRAPTGFDSHSFAQHSDPALLPPTNNPPQRPIEGDDLRIPPNADMMHKPPPDKLSVHTSYPPRSSPSPGLKRVQASATPTSAAGAKSGFDRELDMSFGLPNSASTTSTTSYHTPHEATLIHAPKPIHPPVSVPNVREMPILHNLKSAHGTKNLRGYYERNEGQTHRGHSRGNSQDSSPSSQNSGGGQWHPSATHQGLPAAPNAAVARAPPEMKNLPPPPYPTQQRYYAQ